MKICRLGVLLFLVAAGSHVFGQDDLKLFQKQLSLLHEGKFKEDLPILDSIIKADSLRRDSHRKNGALPKRNFSFVKQKAMLYENIGDYARAEQLFDQVLQAALIAANQGNASLYKSTLDDMAQLYEKMGNGEAAERILEKLVISEYVNQNPKGVSEGVKSNLNKAIDSQFPYVNSKAQYFNHFINEHRKTDSANRAGYLRLSGSANTPENVQAMNNYRNLLNQKFDRAKFMDDLGRKWTIDSMQKSIFNNAFKTASSSDILKADFQAQNFKQPTASQVALLKLGKLPFNGERIMLKVPWTEVQRLFILYKKKHNYRAAEALLRQAIAVDDRHPSSNMDFVKKFYTPQVMEAIRKDAKNGGTVSLVEQSLGLYAWHSGADIYYLQNKALLAQLYDETDSYTRYKPLADTIYRIAKQFDTGSSTLLANDLAPIYSKIGKYADARELYRQLTANTGNTFGDKDHFGTYYLNSLEELAKLDILTGNFDAAESELKRSLIYDWKASRETYPDHLTRVIDLAQLYESTNRFGLAEASCSSNMGPVFNAVKNNFSFLSEQEKLGWINNQIAAFDFSASLLVTDPHPPADFIMQTCNQQLQLKGLILKDEERVFEGIRKSSDQHLKQLFGDWESNKSAIAWQYSQPATPSVRRLIDSLTSIANDEEKRINQLSASFRSNDQNKQIDFKQVQGRLKNDEAAVEFVRFNYYHKKWTDSVRYAAFVILPGDNVPHFVSLCNENELASILNQSSFVDFYGYGDKPVNSKSEALYNLVWKPLSPFLTGIKKIAIAPAGLLNRVAFNALPAKGIIRLADKYEIRQYTSVGGVSGQQPTAERPLATNAMLYGGIDYGELSANNTEDSGLKYLPGTLDEVKQIEGLFKENKKKALILSGSSATKESLIQLSGRSPWIIHLATHGFFHAGAHGSGGNSGETETFSLRDNPMLRSGLYMAGANHGPERDALTGSKDDGVLTAYEISNLDLSNTDLVVLSACETALGDIKGTEGVFGLQRALKLAGVKNMLLSLWPVPDKQTSELMKLFYANKLDGMANYLALRQAQNELRKKNRDPYYWAGFELIE